MNQGDAVNGFTDDYLAGHGMEPTDAIDQIARAIAAQDKNIRYWPALTSICSKASNRWSCPKSAGRNRGPSNGMLVVDPLVIDRAVSKRHGKRTLTLTTEYYGIVPTGISTTPRRTRSPRWTSSNR